MAKKTKTKAKTTKQPRRVPSDEQRVDLMLWHKDGIAAMCDGIPGKTLPQVSVGRTNSKRGLGFEYGDQAFVLDRTQITRLHAFLELQLTRIVDD
jgi:hypothetical protein